MIDPINNPYPHRTGLLVAIPHTGRGLPPKFAWSMMNLHPPMNYQVQYATNLLPNGYAVPASVDYWRNHFAQVAIDKNCKYLLFVDEDVTFEHNALRNLIWTMEHHPEAAVVSGVYCCKTEPAWPLVFRGNGGGPFWDWKVGETFEVTGCGMGMALIRLDALKDIEKPFFETKHEFVNGDLNNIEAWTEDLWALKKLTDKGWKILVDSTVLCSHWDLGTMSAYTLPLTSPPMMRWKFENDLPKVLVVGLDMDFQSQMPISRIDVDWRETKHSDYRCHPARLPFDGGIFDLVLLEQTLGNFVFDECVDIVKEARRMLKAGGIIRISVPDVRAVLGSEDATLEVLYTRKSHWTEKELHRLMATAQIDVEYVISNSGRTMVLEGRVPEPVAVVPSPESEVSDAVHHDADIVAGPPTGTVLTADFGQGGD